MSPKNESPVTPWKMNWDELLLVVILSDFFYLTGEIFTFN